MNLESLLESVCQGDALARGELIQVTYDQLRALAAVRMRAERPDHTLTWLLRELKTENERV